MRSHDSMPQFAEDCWYKKPYKMLSRSRKKEGRKENIMDSDLARKVHHDFAGSMGVVTKSSQSTIYFKTLLSHKIIVACLLPSAVVNCLLVSHFRNIKSPHQSSLFNYQWQRFVWPLHREGDTLVYVALSLILLFRKKFHFDFPPLIPCAPSIPPTYYYLF